MIILTDQIKYLKSKILTTNKKYKISKNEIKSLNLEIKQIRDEKKYEEELSKINIQLNFLQTINDNIIKHSSSANNHEIKLNNNILPEDKEKSVLIFLKKEYIILSLKTKLHSTLIENKQLRDKIIEIAEINNKENLNNMTDLEKLEHNSLRITLNLLMEEKKRMENENSILTSDFYNNLSET